MEFPVSDSDFRVGIICRFDNIAELVLFLNFLQFRFAAYDIGNVNGASVSFNDFNGIKNGLRILFIERFRIRCGVLLECNVKDLNVFRQHDRVCGAYASAFSAKRDGFGAGLFRFFLIFFRLLQLKIHQA